MRNPDEIKKGLEMCTHGADCGHCPYTLLECSHNQMEKDAVSYIRQLEASNAELLTKVKQLEANVKYHKDGFDTLLAECEKLERERDAAVDYLAIAAECKACKHFSHAASEEPCRSCGVGRSNWEWCGVKEE